MIYLYREVGFVILAFKRIRTSAGIRKSADAAFFLPGKARE